MADLQNNNGGGAGKASKPRAKKMAARVDLTPMVDLGFLLITFFMLSTTLAKPQVMALTMPNVEGDTEPVKASKVLTLIPGPRDKVYWYEGLDKAAVDSTDFSPQGLRTVILNKMKKVEAEWGREDYLNPKTHAPSTGSFTNVIIKPARASRYKNLVDVLDEMAICKVRYYTVVDITKEEEVMMPQ
jgi:biopolymer transport protein ExbD